VTILVGHSSREPLPEAVEMAKQAVLDVERQSLDVELRLDAAGLRREAERGCGLLIFYGHGTPDGRLLFNDAAHAFGDLAGPPVGDGFWRVLPLACVFACHGEASPHDDLRRTTEHVTALLAQISAAAAGVPHRRPPPARRRLPTPRRCRIDVTAGRCAAPGPAIVSIRTTEGDAMTPNRATLPRATRIEEPSDAAADTDTGAGTAADKPLSASEAEAIWELSPSRYIARISPRTGQEMRKPIDPDELLVHAHRDHHPLEVAVQYLANRAIALTGKTDLVRKAIRAVNDVGAFVAERVGTTVGTPAAETFAKKLMGVMERDNIFKFRESTHLSEKEVHARVDKLQRDARAALKARGRSPRLHVLLTGATGFLGKELLHQAASDRRIALVTSVVRPESVRDPKTRAVVKVLTPQQRGALLLERLHITGARARKFRFVGGDIEQPGLGLSEADAEKLRKSVTHVIHCAASVSFDDAYENSYKANVLGALNALEFSYSVQAAPDNCFINHVAIETSYIHGRSRTSMAQESELIFPRHFYNNFYELTKAMASMETDRFTIEKGLRVAQLLPSIVIGHSRTGNNRGDTKVVNAPINAFGRAREEAARMSHSLGGRVKATAIGYVAGSFPGHPAAELNLVPVDRVVQGILAALTVPSTIGRRVHLATDNRIRSAEIVRITREELGVSVRLADPTLFRNVTLPVLRALLERLGQERLANALQKLGTIFGGYGEWGQPIHEIGNDVRLLGLSIRRPNTEYAFRMLCRHNKYVQEFGRVRDGDEIARREKVWEQAIDAIELKSGREVGSLAADSFARLLAAEIDLKAFRPRTASARAKPGKERAHADA
jgi:nucleoside-diphosphate-sugar epimerase